MSAQNISLRFKESIYHGLIFKQGGGDI